MFFKVSHSYNESNEKDILKLFKRSSKWDHAGCCSFIRLEMTVKATLKSCTLSLDHKKKKQRKKYILTFFSRYFKSFLNFLSFKTNPRSVTQTV